MLVGCVVMKSRIRMLITALAVGVSFHTLPSADLHDAARDGDLTAVERLLRAGRLVDELDAGLRLTPWQLAQLHGRREVSELLAQAGADTKRPFPEPDEVLRRTLSERVPSSQPGFAVRVSQNGRVLFEGGYGLADVERKVPITPDTVFRIGSVTKQFTATAVLLCEQEGLLKTADSLSKYFPGFPGGEKTTLDHLLHHTSGLKNYTDLPWFMEQVTQSRTAEEVLASFQGLSLDFEPGTAFAYCNSGYFLLGEVVRRVSGERYDELLQRRVFLREKMFSIGAHRPQLALANEARGHAWVEGRWKLAVDWHMSQAGGAGEFYATVADLDRWNEAVFNGRVFTPETLKKAHHPAPSPDGQRETMTSGLAGKYACGWLVDEDRGLRRISHGGGLHGFSSLLSRYPDQKLTVAVLSNSMEPIAGLSPSFIADMAARQFLWREMNPQPCYREAALPEGKALADYRGAFDLGMAGVMRFRVREGRLEGKLASQRWSALRYQGGDEFRLDAVDATFAFERNDKQKVVSVTLRQRGVVLQGARFEEPETGRLAEDALMLYAGRYQLPFGHLTFRVDGPSGGLRGRVEGQPEFGYFPVKGEAARFVCRDVRVEVLFVREGGSLDGPVTGLILQQAGAIVPATRSP